MNNEWETPDDLYQKLDNEFGFQFDLCADKFNTKCDAYTDDIEKFSASYLVCKYDTYWMNPPYSRGDIDKCMAAASSMSGKTVVTLTRLDPSAKWFKQYVDGVAKEVRMFDKRIRFKGAAASYPFPCCISVYRGYTIGETRYHIWGGY